MRTPDYIQDFAIKLYKDGQSLQSVKDEILNRFSFKISTSTIRNVLMNRGIPLRTKGGIESLDVTELEILYFEDNKTLAEIASILNVSVNTVKKYLKDNPYYSVRSKVNYRNLDLNHDYFDIIDTEAKAYLLGFLIADGNVYKDSSYRVRCEVNRRDIEVLKLMKNELNSNNKIIETSKDCVSFCTSSEQLFRDLEKYGVVPNKCKSTFLPILDDSLMCHLLRGILDGDGFTSVFLGKGQLDYRYNIGFTGSNRLMYEIRDYLVNRLNVFNVSVIKSDSTYMILWCAKDDIAKIRDYLYKDANYFFNRKLEKIRYLL